MNEPIPITDAIKACEALIRICDEATPIPLKPLAEFLKRHIRAYFLPGRNLFVTNPEYVAIAAIIDHLSATRPDRAETERDELLSACKVAYSRITDIMGPLGEHLDNPVPSQLRAAIAKAEGRAEQERDALKAERGRLEDLILDIGKAVGATPNYYGPMHSEIRAILVRRKEQK